MHSFKVKSVRHPTLAPEDVPARTLTGKMTTHTDFWWAKLWRKVDVLKRLCEELKHEPELLGYSSTNKERAAQVLNAVEQIERHYSQFAEWFRHVPYHYAYGFDEFKDFVATLDPRKEPKPRKVEKRYMTYFK